MEYVSWKNGVVTLGKMERDCSEFWRWRPENRNVSWDLLTCNTSLLALSISWSRREALQHFRLKGKSICGETLQYLKIDSQSHRLVLFCKNLGGLLAGTKQSCRLLSIPRVLNHACRITVWAPQGSSAPHFGSSAPGLIWCKFCCVSLGIDRDRTRFICWLQNFFRFCVGYRRR